MKDSFIASDICKPLDITARNFQYWLGEGLIVPDVRETQPRIYSQREAFTVGLANYLHIDGGFLNMRRAFRVSRLTIAGLLLLNEKKPTADDEFFLNCYDGLICTAYWGASPSKNNAIFWSDFKSETPYESALMENINSYRSYREYRITRILEDIEEKLFGTNNFEFTFSMDSSVRGREIKDGFWLSMAGDPVQEKN